MKKIIIFALGVAGGAVLRSADITSTRHYRRIWPNEGPILHGLCKNNEKGEHILVHDENSAYKKEGGVRIVFINSVVFKISRDKSPDNIKFTWGDVILDPNFFDKIFPKMMSGFMPRDKIYNFVNVSNECTPGTYEYSAGSSGIVFLR